MVQFQEPPGIEEEIADEVVGEEILDETPAVEPDEQETVDDQPNPLAEMQARLDAFEASVLRRDELNPDQVRSVLGVIQSFQGDIDRLKNQNPVAEIDPRLSANEGVLTALAQAMLESDFLDDSSKAALRQSLGPLSEARTARERAQLRQELLDEVRQQTPQQQPPGYTPEQIQLVATAAALQQRAADLGVDWNAIPAAEKQFRANETMDQAAQRVAALIDRLASEESATDRIVERRAAAGRGTPSRSSGPTSNEDLLARLANDGLPMTAEAERKRAARALGLELPS
ncbi:MAG: hypothetical protein VW362_09565 [Candidatus Nanopelagicales bacterium]